MNYTQKDIDEMNEFHKSIGSGIRYYPLPEPGSKTMEEAIKSIQDALKSYIPKEKLI